MTSLRILFFILFVCGLALPSWAQRRGSGGGVQRLAVGQGIAAPAATSAVSHSNGFTTENPAVAGSVNQPQVSVAYDTGEGTGNNGLAAELGLGNGKVGALLGYGKRNCDGCEGQFGALVGFNLQSLSLGVGYREDNHLSIGALFGDRSGHRFGLTADSMDIENSSDNLTTFGAGYAYYGNSWVFAVDASKQDLRNLPTRDVIKITPGVMVQADWVAVSVSYDMYTNDEHKVFNNDLWFGLGLSGRDMHLAIYHDYSNEWTLAGTLWF